MHWETAVEALRASYGPPAEDVLEFPFDWTDYYTREMGEGLTRAIVSFEEGVRQDRLAEIKEELLELESRFSDFTGGGRRRRVNLDPGLLDLDRFVLATAKNFSHRICLRGTIFAEVELVFRDGDFHPLPWTYPDYRREETLTFFKELRRRWQLRQRSG